jgi:hypothetical protein
MTRRSENLRPSLFEAERPCVELRAAQKEQARDGHRVAISNRRLVAADDGAIAFRWKDYRVSGPGRWKTMGVHPHEFIRRFLMHVLPRGFHRIRHYRLFANANRAENIATVRALLNIAPPAPTRKSIRISPRTRHACCLPLPALWRPYDRGRDLRARLPAEVAPDAEQERHIMSQTASERRNFPLRCAGPTPATIPLDPVTALDAPGAR